MKKILIYILFPVLTVLYSGNVKSQTITNIVQDSIDQNNGGVPLTIIGSSTNFLSGGLYAFLTNGTDTIYCYFIDGPYVNDTVNMFWDIPCTYPEGIYNLVVFDNTDGFMTLPNAIVVYNGMVAGLDIQNPKCNGDLNGAIAETHGGTLPAFQNPNLRGGPSYNWTWYPGGESTSTITNLGPGTYSVVVINNYTSCSDSIGVTLINPPVFTVNYQGVNPNCGFSDGMAYIESITGGIPPYVISWMPNQSSNDTIYNLPTGPYGVMVTDSFECVFQDYFELKEQLTLDVATVNTTCGSINGNAALTILNGTAPYEIFWTNGDYNTMNADSLTPGQYSVQATDAGGCYGATVFNIIATNGPQITSVITGAPSCFGVQDATIDITVSGGTAPYTFLWSTGATTEDLSNLASGIYEVTVTDNNGCSVGSCISIADDTRLRIDYAGSTAANCGLSDGSAEIQFTGGVAPITIQWDAATGGQTTNIASFLAPGFYSVMVTDALGCSDSASVAVSNTTGPMFTVDSMNTADCGMSNGNLFVTPDVTNCIYQLQTYDSYGDGWNGGFLTVVVNGDSTVYFASGGGTNFNIPVPAGGIIHLNYTSGGWENENSYILYDCSGTQAYADGPNPIVGPVFTDTAAAATGTYTWIWSNGELGEDLVNVSSGWYQYTLIDPLGCKSNAFLQVNGTAPAGQDICMVTVDSASGNNLVVWEKAIVSDIDHYNIYREACGDINGMVFIGSQPYDSLSQFIDVGANALVRSWRYRMTAVDICGTESEVSSVHKTVHLAVTRGANNTAQLEWDNYIGFSYTDQIIWRYHNSTGWQKIDTVAANVHLYYDASPLAADTVEYVIEIYPGFPCVATRAENHNYTRSNRGGVAPPESTGSKSQDENNSVYAFPNPSSGNFNLVFELNASATLQLMVYDASGKLVRNQPLNLSPGKNNYSLSLEHLPSGIYQVVARDENLILNTRIIKN
ncbi:MAG: T9SS type A sorting domain-containing protein [Bacteroidota bacterium]